MNRKVKGRWRGGGAVGALVGKRTRLKIGC